MFSWILIRGFAKQCFVLELWLDLLTWNAFSEQCEAKLVHVVLLLNLAVSYALER